MTLRWRLALASIAAAAAGLLVVGLVLWVPLRNYNQDIATAQLARDLTAARNQLGRVGFRSDRALGVLVNFQETAGVTVFVANAGGEVLLSDPPLPSPVAFQSRVPDGPGPVRLSIGGAPYLAYVLPASRLGGLAQARLPAGGILVVAQSQADVDQRTSQQLLPAVGLAALAALVVAAAVGTALATSMTRRLEQLRSGARAIARGDYAHRVHLGGSDELSELGGDFDIMAARVESTTRSQRELLANVSHELRTPLTSVLGFSEALLDGKVEGEEGVHRAARIINSEASRLLRISRDLVDLARMESGQVALNLTAVDTAGLLNSLRLRFEPRAGQTGLVWESVVDPQCGTVRADADRLNQVLDNLAENALRYADRSQPVTVTAACSGADIVIAVENAAHGLPADPERLFERFYRADPAREGGGAGLGLAVARELTRAMGGRLHAGFPEPARIRFEIHLPRG